MMTKEEEEFLLKFQEKFAINQHLQQAITPHKHLLKNKQSLVLIHPMPPQHKMQQICQDLNLIKIMIQVIPIPIHIIQIKAETKMDLHSIPTVHLPVAPKPAQFQVIPHSLIQSTAILQAPQPRQRSRALQQQLFQVQTRTHACVSR